MGPALLALLAFAGTAGGLVATSGLLDGQLPRHTPSAFRSSAGDPGPGDVPRPTTAPSAPAGQAPTQHAAGPSPDDFADIRTAPRVRSGPRRDAAASTGVFFAHCGTNAEGHRNTDNFIAAPQVRNGAHHLHDYVGNRSTDGFSTDQSLLVAGTTCTRGDKSVYFWPVLRVRGEGDGAGPDGNAGRVITPRSVTLRFRGNDMAPVTAMPKFLKAVTGDARAFTSGPANARARWTCTGFEQRGFTDRYPRCPAASDIMRILDFPGCWDGRNTDSANHRAHLTFARRNGACPPRTRPVPQLRLTLTYRVAPGVDYALDSFPDQLHKPVTDHADFANVMPNRLMNLVVSCINRGRVCD